MSTNKAREKCKNIKEREETALTQRTRSQEHTPCFFLAPSEKKKKKKEDPALLLHSFLIYFFFCLQCRKEEGLLSFTSLQDLGSLQRPV